MSDNTQWDMVNTRLNINNTNEDTYDENEHNMVWTNKLTEV